MQDYHLINPTQELQPFEFEVATLAYQGELPGGGRQLNVQRQRQQAYQYRENLGNGISLEMVAIPAGTFLMGSPAGEKERFSSESPQHEVSVLPFFMGKYPITQAQWSAVASLPQINQELNADHPSYFKGDNRPVERVSWDHATEFCARLSQYTGREYRLPSEAEWEYGCRAGTTTPFHFGETITTDLANYDGNYTYGEGTTGESRRETTPVDHFGIANGFSLCEMHGNVWEWCQDQWHRNYEGAPIDGSAWLDGNENDSHVLRGGSWDHNPRYCRSAFRDLNSSEGAYLVIGFRVVCVLPRTS